MSADLPEAALCKHTDLKADDLRKARNLRFAKGDSSAKIAIDRLSEAGARARDPEAILVLPRTRGDCFSVSTLLRNLSQVDESVVE